MNSFLASLTAVDLGVFLLMGGLGLIGLARGFVAELISFGAWVAGLIAVRVFQAPVADWLTPYLPMPGAATVLAHGLVFALAFFLVKFAGARIGSASRESFLGPVDRALGFGFGAVKGLAIATTLFLGFTIGYDVIYGGRTARPDWMTASRTYPLLQAAATSVERAVASRRQR